MDDDTLDIGFGAGANRMVSVAKTGQDGEMRLSAGEAYAQRKLDELNRMSTALERGLGWDYGDILPVARDPATGRERWGVMPNIVRDTLQGAVDLMAMPYTGQLTTEAVGAVTGLPATGLRAARQVGFTTARRAMAGISDEELGHYSAPDKPVRAFTADYPNGAPVDETGRLLQDMDGNDLASTSVIVGRNTRGGKDQTLLPDDYDALSMATLGKLPERKPSAEMEGASGETRYDPNTRLPKKIALADELTPGQWNKVYAHELGHVFDQIVGEISTQGLEDELRRVYSTMRSGKEGGELLSPEDVGYPAAEVPRELVAEAFRAYMDNPNYLKSVAPNAAAAIRGVVNTHPVLGKIIQFNVQGSGVPMPVPGQTRPATEQQMPRYRRGSRYLEV